MSRCACTNIHNQRAKKLTFTTLFSAPYLLLCLATGWQKDTQSSFSAAINRGRIKGIFLEEIDFKLCGVHIVFVVPFI